MANSKKFWMGIALGAIAGGAISLFDKETRQSVKEDFNKASGSVAYIAKHPNEFINEVKDTVNKVKATVEQVTEDVAFIAEKVEEIKEIPPQVAEIVQDTKDSLSKIAKTDENQIG